MADIVYSFRSVPTLRAFAHDDSFIRGIRGPVGSGKSSICALEMLRRGIRQHPGPDGVRRSRYAVVRNTYQQLKDTTVRTVHQWLPPERFGRWRASDNTYVIDKVPGVHIEVLFRALDRPDQIGNLLSLELTGAWVNEAREVPKAIIDALTGRVGRYPAMWEGGASWAGIWMDTNAPDDDSWWYEMFEEASGLEELEESLRERSILAEDAALLRQFVQPSGRGPDAENIPNLRPGYYDIIQAGKTKDWIKVYVDGEYGSLADGRSIYGAEWSDSVHVNSDIEPIPGVPLIVGIDFGLTPAAVIGQLAPTGQLRIYYEVVSEHIGIRRFAKNMLQPLLSQYFQGYPIEYEGDPAGGAMHETDERSALEILAQEGIEASPASTNQPTARWDAVKWFLTQMDGGVPMFALHPRCKMLRKGFAGGYRMRRLQVVGEDLYTDHAVKNKYSHPHDALQYLALRARSGYTHSAPNSKPRRRASWATA